MIARRQWDLDTGILTAECRRGCVTWTWEPFVRDLRRYERGETFPPVTLDRDEVRYELQRAGVA